MKDFIENTMRMSSFYQPLILKILLMKDNISNEEMAIICHNYCDKYSSENYAKKLKNYPAKVLKSHNMAKLENGVWSLICPVDQDCMELLERKLMK